MIKRQIKDPLGGGGIDRGTKTWNMDYHNPTELEKSVRLRFSRQKYREPTSGSAAGIDEMNHSGPDCEREQT